MKKYAIAVMQPYFMPYLGYFQLMNAVSTFVIFDDVNFIKQGYICSNNILICGKAFAFSIPVKNKSQNKLICETEMSFSPKEREKFLRMITLSYKKAPFFDDAYELIKNIVLFDTQDLTLFIKNSLEKVASFLGIKSKIVLSSSLSIDHQYKGEDRIIRICEMLNADTYINAIGGMSLYSFENFKNHKITLKFIKMNDHSYRQFNDKEFVKNLSIIDLIMFNDKNELSRLLNDYVIIGE